ncbi:MAG: DUF11 domain-containing protein [Thermoplasmatales archaeon]|nr:DUF11 domain-containing protein [Thermoplasmatales archaeon]
MKNHRNSTMVFLTIVMLILSSLATVTTSKQYGVLNTSEVTIEKYVKLLEISDDCVSNDDNFFKKQISALIYDEVIFKLYVNNTGDQTLDIKVWDDLPLGLIYNNHAIVDGVVQEPLFIDEDTFFWDIPDVDPGHTIIITYMAIVEECGSHINVAYVTGGSESQSILDEDTAIVEVSCDEPEIIIEKTVWNGTSWAEYAEVSLGKTVYFKGEVHNPNEYEIDFSGVIYDKFPDNLEYIPESSTLLDLTEHVVEIIDLDNNTVYWYRVPVIPPGEILTFYFNATAVDCGIGINNITAEAYVVYSNENRIPVNDSDEATVYVDCIPCEEANITVEKYVKWDCSTDFKKYVDAEIGDYVIFKLIVNNTGETPLDIVVVDEIPPGLSYAGNANPEPDDVNGNIITWYFYNVEPETSIVITFRADVDECGEQINLVNVTGTFENQIVYDEDTATVNVICPDEPGISVIKSVKKFDSGEYSNYVTIDLGCWAVFRINVTNTGELPLDIIVRDKLPSGLEYNNSATPWEPEFIDGNYTWYFEDVDPQESIIITFKVRGIEVEEHINLVNVTGITEQEEVNDEDTAIVNVICDEEPELEIGIEEAFFIGKLRAFVKNNKETDLSDVTWDITVKSIGLLKKINSTTEDIIELLESEEKKTLKTEVIRGFGKIEVVVKATAPELDPVTITKTGFVLGRIIILFPPK